MNPDMGTAEERKAAEDDLGFKLDDGDCLGTVAKESHGQRGRSNMTRDFFKSKCADYGSMEGKVCLVTGANTGVGYETARHFAKLRGHVFLGCRSQEKGQAAVEKIVAETGNAKVEFLSLDLNSLAKVKAAADLFLSKGIPLHILVNNAGFGSAGLLTEDGYEAHLGVMHLGHYYLTTLLLPCLRDSAADGPGGKARVVNVASHMHWASSGAPKFLHKPEQFLASLERCKEVTTEEDNVGRGYGTAKLANILHANELARREPDVIAVSCMPGAVATEVFRAYDNDFWMNYVFCCMGAMWRSVKSTFLTPEQGAQMQIQMALDPEVVSGTYWDDFREGYSQSKCAKDPALAAKLWEWSEAQVTGLATTEEGYIY